jgi:predicted component of type VI protein secretion system
MPARLLIYTGKLKGKALALPAEGKVVLGRSQQAHITIPDGNLSRAHCAASSAGKGYKLEDLKSTNGTFVNGKQIDQVLLHDGDRIVIGETEMEFRTQERFDDTETKMDLVPVGQPEPESPRAKPSRVAPAPGQPGPASAPSGGTTTKLSRVSFCDICDISVPKKDIDTGAARDISDRLLCTQCVGLLEGKNLDAAASVDRLLDELRAEVQRG